MAPPPALAAFGCVLFLLAWLAMAKDRWSCLPLGRAVSVVAIGALFVSSSLLSPSEAFAAINVPTLALLLGCMLISGVMEKHGAYSMLQDALASGASSPALLLLRISLVAGACSAIITNDATCVVLTPLVLRACLARRLHPAPFLVALATSSNIGSALSPIGNPQNMLVALLGNLFFVDFLRGIAAAALLGLAINVGVIALVYRAEIFGAGAGQYVASPEQRRAVGLAEADIAADGSAIASQGRAEEAHEEGDEVSLAAAQDSVVAIVEPLQTGPEQGISSEAAGVAPPSPPAPSGSSTPISPLSLLRRRAIFLVLAALPVVLVAADSWIGLSWVVLLIASLLLVLDGDAPDAVLARVDAPLLLFFSGLFVVVAGLNATALPGAAWAAAVSAGIGLRSVGGAILFTLVVLAGSNTVSNVPLVLLLAPSVAALPVDVKLTWLMLAFVSTVAGNLTLMGSVANLIVAEKAKAAFELTFVEYAKIGVLSTLLVCVVGVPLVWACAK